MSHKSIVNAILLVITLLSIGTSRHKSDITISLIPPSLVNPFHVSIASGSKGQADEYGWNLIVRAPERETDIEGQVTVVEQVVQRRVDAISVNPINADAILAGVRAANEANIPVFMQNLITPIEEGEVVEYIGYDQWGGAANLAAFVCEQLAANQHVEPSDVTGEVFILTGIPGFHTNRRTGGFRYGLENNCPNVEVVGEQTAEWERERAMQVATAALQQHPHINVFFGNSDEMAIGAALAAQQLGLVIGDDIFVVGIDGNDVTLDLIREGTITATLGVYPDRMGAVVIQQIKKYLNSEQLPRILLTPSIVVDRQNVDAYIAGDTWIDPIAGVPEIDNGQPTINEE